MILVDFSDVKIEPKSGIQLAIKSGSQSASQVSHENCYEGTENISDGKL